MTLALNLDLLAVARRYAADPDDWPFAPRFDPTRRWYARLARTDDHEVWLLTWLPGQFTDLHDHGGSAGAFTVVSGEVVEQIVANYSRGADGGRTAARYSQGAKYAKNEGHRFGPHHVHRIVNVSNRPAVTVHAYGPALRSMTRYRLDNGDLIAEDVSEAGVDW